MFGGRVDGWTDGRTDGWADGLTFVPAEDDSTARGISPVVTLSAPSDETEPVPPECPPMNLESGKRRGALSR